jgi:F-type H+-transporting ATPase subunit b
MNKALLQCVRVALVLSVVIGVAGTSLAGQPERPAEPEAHAGAAETHPEAAEEHAEGTLAETIARLVNFGILAGVLAYFLRSPIAKYLTDRKQQVRNDLETAVAVRQAAGEQVAEIDRRLAALPGEIDALKARAAQEVAAEETRIRQAADAERDRLLEQTRREIELQLKAAKRELLEEAAGLAVGIASDRIRRDITSTDHLRLVDRYLEQVGRPADAVDPGRSSS